MNSIKNTFSIKDLENLTGIKAHTIRIWEKRYKLLEPNRTLTNIRFYSLASLQKLLNISYLNNNGYKISKIAALNSSEIASLVKEIANSDKHNNHSLNIFKLAMINFDLDLFQKTYYNLLKVYSFSEIFQNIFIPLLDEIGILWQTDTINPAQEHFVSELIKQKILIHTEKAIEDNPTTNAETVYVLFLPMNEIHELGLQYLNYELNSLKCHTLYLGQSVPISSLEDLTKYYKNITFVSSFTVQPFTEKLSDYLTEFNQKLLKKTNNKFWVTGRRIKEQPELLNNFDEITTFDSLKEIIISVPQLIN